MLQSLSQLEERYGRQGANTILACDVASRVFFSGMDIDTAQMLVRILGDTHPRSHRRPSNLKSECEPLITLAALRSMPDTQLLYLFANKRQALIQVTPYYENRALKRRTEPAPGIASGAVARKVEFARL